MQSQKAGKCLLSCQEIFLKMIETSIVEEAQRTGIRACHRRSGSEWVFREIWRRPWQPERRIRTWMSPGSGPVAC